MMELGLEIIERPLAEAELEGFGQVDFPDGFAPVVARPSKRAKTAMQAHSRRDGESAQKWRDIRGAEEGSQKATQRIRLAAKGLAYRTKQPPCRGPPHVPTGPYPLRRPPVGHVQFFEDFVPIIQR